MRTAACIFLLFAFGVTNASEDQATESDGKHINSSVSNHTLNSSW